jgi:hypothetical protein
MFENNRVLEEYFKQEQQPEPQVQEEQKATKDLACKLFSSI